MQREPLSTGEHPHLGLTFELLLNLHPLNVPTLGFGEAVVLEAGQGGRSLMEAERFNRGGGKTQAVEGYAG